MTGQIFISYRRDDSSGITGRIYDRLLQLFDKDQIFWDIETIPPGVDFVKKLNIALERCDVLIAVIGKNWLSTDDVKKQSKILKPNDFVRKEIRTALTRKIGLIPVLIEETKMPESIDLPKGIRALTRLQAFKIRNASFETDIELLKCQLRKILAKAIEDTIKVDKNYFEQSEPVNEIFSGDQEKIKRDERDRVIVQTIKSLISNGQYEDVFEKLNQLDALKTNFEIIDLNNKLGQLNKSYISNHISRHRYFDERDSIFIKVLDTINQIN